MSTYAATLDLLAAIWVYPTLVIAAIGLGVVNYPVWGLMAALANRSFQADLAVRAVSLGLVAAAVLGAIGNSLTGLWIDETGSMREPIVLLAILTSGSALWLSVMHRQERTAGGEVTNPAQPDA